MQVSHSSYVGSMIPIIRTPVVLMCESSTYSDYPEHYFEYTNYEDADYADYKDNGNTELTDVPNKAN